MCERLRFATGELHHCLRRRGKHEKCEANGESLAVHRCWSCGTQWVRVPGGYIEVGDSRKIRYK